MARNRRIGTSLSGVAQFVGARGIGELTKWADKGYNYIKKYDKHLSEEQKIPESIKITSIKPSGTVSLLAGATPGIHFPLSQNYIRRIRV
jgi:ribonucleoside-triphosphate reductase